ncbi:hypothetical protein LguiB_031385 [Lonicera macranthoides]
MAGHSSNSKKNNGIVKLKLVVEKVQRSLLKGKKWAPEVDELNESNDSTDVPSDVKEGHFAVIAVNDDEVKRFVIPLTCLSHPLFLKLLDQAAEEYGFDREGVLTLPCRPSDLERILLDEK